MQIMCAMQDSPELNSIRQFAMEYQITPKAADAPGTNFWKTQICALTTDAGIGGEKFKGIVSALPKTSARRWDCPDGVHLTSYPGC
jgi:Tfp pilus assembly protein PilV